MRDALVAMVQTWQQALERAIHIAVDEGHLRADTEPAQMLFEVHGLILALHHDARFLRNPGAVERARTAFQRVLSYYTEGAADTARALHKRKPAPSIPEHSQE